MWHLWVCNPNVSSVFNHLMASLLRFTRWPKKSNMTNVRAVLSTTDCKAFLSAHIHRNKSQTEIGSSFSLESNRLRRVSRNWFKCLNYAVLINYRRNQYYVTHRLFLSSNVFTIIHFSVLFSRNTILFVSSRPPYSFLFPNRWWAKTKNHPPSAITCHVRHLSAGVFSGPAWHGAFWLLLWKTSYTKHTAKTLLEAGVLEGGQLLP